MQRPYAPMQSTSTTSPSLVLNGNTRSLQTTHQQQKTALSQNQSKRDEKNQRTDKM
eukprot:m.511562 g.511562  ORF g.511562 m.511562 type:complete len:56 (+) comp57426_c0_seq8:91-258(+)